MDLIFARLSIMIAINTAGHLNRRGELMPDTVFVRGAVTYLSLDLGPQSNYDVPRAKLWVWMGNSRQEWVRAWWDSFFDTIFAIGCVQLIVLWTPSFHWITAHNSK